MGKLQWILGLVATTLLSSCSETAMDGKVKNPNEEIATFGGGCFWCTEAVMEHMTGVLDVRSGYMGGQLQEPTYEQVCKGDTGHAEVIQVAFDAEKISFAELLDVFWQAHDPTTLNQQGADRGSQYRSVVFYHSPEQRAQAQRSKELLDESGRYAAPAVTEISPADTFWEAEEEHQDFYKKRPDHSYCRLVIHPKLKKLGLRKGEED